MRWVAFSSVFAGIAGYVVIFLAAQTFGGKGVEYGVFNAYWGLFFVIQGTLQGLMHETTRGVRASLIRDRGSDDVDDPTADELLTEPLDESERAVEPDRRARPFRLAFAFGLVAAGVVLATGPLWGPAIILDGPVELGVWLMTAATFLAAVQAVFCGLVSGSGRWRMFGLFLTFEALARVLVAAGALLTGASIAAFMYATIAGLVMTPLTLLAMPGARELVGVRTDTSTRDFVVRGLHAMLAAGAAATLVVGFSVILAVTRQGANTEVVNNLLLAVMLTRAPILTPITSFQNAIVVYFVDRVRRGRRVVWAPIAIVMGVASVGAILAWLVGPPIMSLMGEGFGVGGQVLAALTFAAGFTGSLYVTGAAVLARERHGVYVTGWLLATGIAILLLVVVPGDVVATVVALIVGPAIGCAYHVLVGMAPTRGERLRGAGGHDAGDGSAPAGDDPSAAEGPLVRPGEGDDAARGHAAAGRRTERGSAAEA